MKDKSETVCARRCFNLERDRELISSKEFTSDGKNLVDGLFSFLLEKRKNHLFESVLMADVRVLDN